MPVIVELVDSPPPWEAARRLADWPHLLLLESADRAVPSQLNRYSFVTADPSVWLTGRIDDGDCPDFAAIRELHAGLHFETVPGLPPFQGGVAGMFGYGLSRLTERLPRPRSDPFEVPDVGVGQYDWVLAYDHQQDRCWFIDHGNSGREALDRLARRIVTGAMPTALRGHATGDSCPPKAVGMPPAMTRLTGFPNVGSTFDRAGLEAAVARAIEYTHAGDCFQVNIAQELSAHCDDPLALYSRLRECNPAPFAAYLDLGEYVVVSASPERFVQVDAAGRVNTRPIKGTRPRSADPIADAAALAQLLASAKDRAENVMIVDLLRNDLGKVCAYGSVRATRVCEPESYRTVHHLVSEVVGQLAPGRSALDLLKAAFPGGSITGAPKVRAMEIIAELEPTARGAYCGSLGYLSGDGSMDTNIAIRTFTVGRGWARFPVGAGIVADSEPAAEYDETLAKAEGLLRALKP